MQLDASPSSHSTGEQRMIGEALWWWVFSFMLLSLVYITGMVSSSALPRIIGEYPTKPVNERPHFDTVSEVVTTNSIDLELIGEPNPTGFLRVVRSDPRVLDIEHPERYRPDWVPGRTELQQADHYRSQIGIQGRTYSLLARAMGLERDDTFGVLRTFSSVALAAMLALLVATLYLAWGRAPAGAALAFCVLSTGFNLFGPSLHWVAFIHVAPTVIMAILATKLPEARWTARLLAFGLAGFFFFLKFGSGYEFMTATVAATTIPFFVAYSVGRISMATLVKLSFAVFALGTVVFVATLLLHNQLFMAAFGGSGLEWMSRRSAAWVGTPGVGPLGGLTDIAKVLAVNAIDVDGYGVPNGLFILLGLPFVFMAARALLARRVDEERARVAIVIAAALLASASWLVLQFPHVAFHARFSTVLISFPYGIVLFAGIARYWILRRQAR
jgi:hypothetical protein